MNIEFKKSLLASALGALMLAGCGGGGSDAGTTTPTTPSGVITDTGRFVDAPVSGLGFQSGSLSGVTAANGDFDYVVGEQAAFKVGSRVNLGSAAGKSLMSPLDLVPAHADDRIVKAMASLLQSLDTDGDQANGIQLTPAMIGLLEAQLGASGIDFTTWDDEGFDLDGALASLEAILMAVDAAADTDGDDSTNPTYVDPDQAASDLLANLAQLDLYQRNISKTPEAPSDKAGVEMLDIVVPARAADGTLLDGEVNPLVANYADGVGPNGEWDPFVAVSFDNGLTWKRTNLFRKAGEEIRVNNVTFHAKSGGPSMAVSGDYLLVSWISTFCPGAPDYAGENGIVDTAVNPAVDLLGDVDGVDGTVNDWFKILGPQGTVTYYFDNGTTLTNPYYCVWAARGVVEEVDGLTDIVWRAPEQITSGVRDAKLDWPAVTGGIGFGLTWQEDPEGLLPGEGEGPGVGWSGATTHHRTDIWYNFLRWEDFAAIAEEVVIDEQDPTDTRPKVAVTFSVPVPVSDNNSCKTDASSGNIPDYCDTSLVADTPYCADTVTVTTQVGGGGTSTGTFCVTEDGAVLDGDTGASRPNLHFAAKLDDATGEVIGARALLTYEETKGLCEEGKGCPDAPYDVGKFVMYHHMPDFDAPLIVDGGDILSAPVTLATTDPLDPGAVFEPVDDPTTERDESVLYENSRRERFVVNSDPNHPVKLVVIYKQGWYNQGERADIFARRAVGGYEIENFSPPMCASCVMPVETEITEGDNYTYTTKVLTWDWLPEYVDHESWTNPYDDARSLRAKLDGDRLLIAYGWTPNWLLTTVLGGDGYFKDNYDFLVRRSYNVDSGYTINADGSVTFLEEGANQAIFFEAPVNTSNIASNKENQVEPRLVTVPGSVLDCPSWGIGEVQDPAACVIPSTAAEGSHKFIVTYCTAVNTEREGPDGRPVHAPGLDCFYSWSQDSGKTFVATDEDGDGIIDFECLACQKDLEEVEPEVILTEDGMTAHAAWVANGELDESGSDMQNGSDAWYGQFSLVPEEEVPTE